MVVEKRKDSSVEHGHPLLRKRSSPVVVHSPQRRRIVRWKDPQVQLAFFRSCYANKVHVATGVPVHVKWEIVASELSQTELFPPNLHINTFRIRFATFLQDFLAEEREGRRSEQCGPSECDVLLRKMAHEWTLGHREGDNDSSGGDGVTSSSKEVLGDPLEGAMSLDEEESGSSSPSALLSSNGDPLVLLEVLTTIREAGLHHLLENEEHDAPWQTAADALLHNPRCHDLPCPFNGCQLRQLYLALIQQLCDGELDPADGVAWTCMLREMHEDNGQVIKDSNDPPPSIGCVTNRQLLVQREVAEEREDWMKCPAVVCSSPAHLVELPEEAPNTQKAAERAKWVALLKNSRLRTAEMQTGKVEIKALLQTTRTLCLDALVACQQATLRACLGSTRYEDR